MEVNIIYLILFIILNILIFIALYKENINNKKFTKFKLMIILIICSFIINILFFIFIINLILSIEYLIKVIKL
jgi:hypothetical protein